MNLLLYPKHINMKDGQTQCMKRWITMKKPIPLLWFQELQMADIFLKALPFAFSSLRFKLGIALSHTPSLSGSIKSNPSTATKALLNDRNSGSSVTKDRNDVVLRNSSAEYKNLGQSKAHTTFTVCSNVFFLSFFSGQQLSF